MTRLLYSVLLIIGSATSQEDTFSQEGKDALGVCEADLECSNRLSPLISACSTMTCQPQSRMAALNVYQNRLGRVLFRTDASCIPGRMELRKCHFLPLAQLVHCSLAKLTCEADVECNSAWEAFVSECEGESRKGVCSPRCAALLKATTSTRQGQSLSNCTCTEREDQLCENLRDSVISLCSMAPKSLPPPPDNSIAPFLSHSDPDETGAISFSFALISSFYPILIISRFLLS